MLFKLCKYINVSKGTVKKEGKEKICLFACLSAYLPHPSACPAKKGFVCLSAYLPHPPRPPAGWPDHPPTLLYM